MGKLNYTAELPKICTISELLRNQTALVYDIDAWIDPFQEFVEINFGKGDFLFFITTQMENDKIETL